MAIPELDLKKVNLQAAVGYLISLHDNEVDWNLLGIKVIGHIDALPIPEGTYEYGDAYMVGTETPYDMYIYTRPDGTVHTEGYWFPIGKFPMPGPVGKDGSLADITASTTTNNVVTYDSTDGANIVGTTTISFKNSAGETQTSSYQNEFYVPFAPGDEYLTMDSDAGNTRVEIKLDKPSLALDFYQVNKSSDGSTSVPAWDGTKIVSIPYTKDEDITYANAFVKTNNYGRIFVNRIKFPVAFGGNYSAFEYGNSSYQIRWFITDNFYKDIEISTLPSNSGTLSASQLTTFVSCKNVNVLYRGYSHIRQSPITSTGQINYVSTECGENTITIRSFVLNAQSGAWTWEEKTFPTVFYYTHRVVIYDGSGNDYYTITLTNSRANSYANLGDNLTSLFNDIGTSGVMAYKNTPEGQYVPVLLTRDATSESAIHWQTGTQTGTIEQTTIADIQDHITPSITNN